MQSNQQPEEEEDCVICNESLPKLNSKFVRMTCCGKGLHKKCNDDINTSSLIDKRKNQCIVCRTASPKSAEEGVERIRRWVEKGKAWAQSILAQRYEHGLGVEQSYQRAAELYDLAASQGFAGAQYNLGVMHERGQGVDQSNERAVEYFKAAARQGLANAQFNLGVHYANGDGVEQSLEIAREWWMKAAEQGQENAIYNLQQLDKAEGRTTPSFTPPKRCSTCDTPKTSTHKLKKYSTHSNIYSIK